jgi:uncharacterized membrane protein YdjX (TVP38/TMEM64 family)
MGKAGGMNEPSCGRTKTRSERAFSLLVFAPVKITLPDVTVTPPSPVRPQVDPREETPEPAKATAPRKAKLAGTGLVLLAAIAGLVWLTRQTDVADGVRHGVAFFRQAGPLPFFAAMALLPAVGFPLAPFVVAAGPVFGPTIGIGPVILGTVGAVMVNVALSYWISGRLLRPWIRRIVAWLGYRLPEIRGKSAWNATLVVRIVPGPPFFLQSYLLGLARIPFGVYMCVSTLVPSAYVVGVILFGDALARGDRSAMLGGGGVMIVVGAAIHQLRRRLGAKKPDPAARPPEPLSPAT